VVGEGRDEFDAGAAAAPGGVEEATAGSCFSSMTLSWLPRRLRRKERRRRSAKWGEVGVDLDVCDDEGRLLAADRFSEAGEAACRGGCAPVRTGRGLSSVSATLVPTEMTLALS
jgi:hypothetical protein